MTTDAILKYVGLLGVGIAATMAGMYLYNRLPGNQPKVLPPSTAAAQTTATS